MIPDNFNGKTRRHTWDYRNEQGEIIGHVARYDGDGKKDIAPFFKRNGAGFVMGGANEPRPLFGLGILANADPARAVFVVEGEKAAAALHSLGLVAVTSQGGAKAAEKADWSRLAGHSAVFLLPDNDEPGEGYITTIAGILSRFENPPALSLVRLPNLPEGGDIVDWLKTRLDDALLDWDEFEPVPDLSLKEVFQAVVKAHVEPVPDDWTAAPTENVAEWQAPISLEASYLPPWPDAVFPDVVQEFVNALSASTETPSELASLMVLAAISAAAQGRFRVRVKADYFEPVNVWPCCALIPGSRKTAVQNAATAPLTLWEGWQREILEPKIRRAKSEHATITEQIMHLRKQAAKLAGAEFDKLKEQIANLEAKLPEIPTVPQVWAQDVTPENLGTLMGDNGERMAVLSDEAGIFDTLAGRYSGGIPNLDLFLQGHAGSPVRVNRGSRPSIFMKSPCLTLGLSPQPEVLRGLTANPSFRGRGLLGRFLYALPTSNLGYRTLDTRPMPEEVKERYGRVITDILNTAPAYDAEGNHCPHILKLSSEARDAFQAFSLKVEAGMREGGTFAHITDWAGKLPGAVARIAALFHIARHASDGPGQLEISIEDMTAALRMGDTLSAHALAVFDLMGADPALDGARVILRWIEREGKAEFTFRDCHYAHKTRYKRSSEIEPAIEVLAERHFIRQRVEKVAHRPSRIFEVNPGFLKNET